MRSTEGAVLSVSLLSMLIGSVFLTGCDNWRGLGADIGKEGDVMMGEKCTMMVHAFPVKSTVAVRRALEQLEMTDIDNIGCIHHARVTARTAQQGRVTIDIDQWSETDSMVTIHIHGREAGAVNRQIQDGVRRNLQ